MDQAHSVEERLFWLEAALANARGEAMGLWLWILENHPGADILSQAHLGQEMLDRLALAEDVGHDSVVDGLFELRGALKEALELVAVPRDPVKFKQLREVLNRWGELHLRIIKKGEEDV